MDNVKTLTVKTEEIIEQAYAAAVRTCFDTLVGSLAGSGEDQARRQKAKGSYAACVATAKEARDTALQVSVE